MADPPERPDERSDTGMPAKKATPRKAPAKKVPAKKVPAKKVPAKKVPAKKVPAKKAAPRTAPIEPKTAPPTAEAALKPAPHDDAGAAPRPIRGVGHPVSPPGPPSRSGRYTRIPIAIGLAAASAGAMLIRRLRRG